MDNYEKGNKEGLINFLKTSLGGQSIDLIDGLDFDFMQNLNTRKLLFFFFFFSFFFII